MKIKLSFHIIRECFSGTSPEENGDYRKHAPHECPLSRKAIAYDVISTENYQNCLINIRVTIKSADDRQTLDLMYHYH